MRFPTSIWTRILQVREDPEGVRDLVVRRYRPPVYDYARKQGLNHEDAEDAAQEVFLRVCAEGFLEKADRQKGKFRALLLAVARHVIASHRRHALAARRDRRREVVLEDFEFPSQVPSDGDFDLAWAENLARLALERLKGNPSVDLLLEHMKGATCKELAARVGKTEHAVETQVYRAKERVRQEIERLVADYSDEGEIDEELSAILQFLVRLRRRPR